MAYRLMWVHALLLCCAVQVEDIAKEHDTRLAVDCTRAYHFGARCECTCDLYCLFVYSGPAVSARVICTVYSYIRIFVAQLLFPLRLS